MGPLAISGGGGGNDSVSKEATQTSVVGASPVDITGWTGYEITAGWHDITIAGELEGLVGGAQLSLVCPTASGINGSLIGFSSYQNASQVVRVSSTELRMVLSTGSASRLNFFATCRIKFSAAGTAKFQLRAYSGSNTATIYNGVATIAKVRV